MHLLLGEFGAVHVRDPGWNSHFVFGRARKLGAFGLEYQGLGAQPAPFAFGTGLDFDAQGVALLVCCRVGNRDHGLIERDGEARCSLEFPFRSDREDLERLALHFGRRVALAGGWERDLFGSDRARSGFGARTLQKLRFILFRFQRLGEHLQNLVDASLRERRAGDDRTLGCIGVDGFALREDDLERFRFPIFRHPGRPRTSLGVAPRPAVTGKTE